MTETYVEEQVLAFHAAGQWREIINLGLNEEDYEGRRLLWVWPSADDLQWITNIAKKFKVAGITSIGCGSGLLEWIVQRYSGLDIIGIETDKSWWTSGYSPPQFLKETVFIDDNAKVRIPMNHAIFFCYFNNGPAFLDYMGNYEGSVVIVIGPDEGKNRTTDPLPFDKKIPMLGWKLRDTRKLDNGKDVATVYTR